MWYMRRNLLLPPTAAISDLVKAQKQPKQIRAIILMNGETTW